MLAGGRKLLSEVVSKAFDTFENAMKAGIRLKKIKAVNFMVQYLLQDIDVPFEIRKLASEYSVQAAKLSKDSPEKPKEAKPERLAQKDGKNGKRKSYNKRRSTYSDDHLFRALFINIQGSYNAKLRSILSIYAESIDCLVLAETWHQELNAPEYMPWFLAHTPKRQQDLHIAIGRAHHGLAVFLKPDLKKFVNELKILQNSIYFRVGTL
ncbi:hypothetical protein MP638_002673, partial [Amoeboaphelidium occidentale]